MADVIEKTLQTRIINKHGTYDEWSKSNLVLKAGEIALAQFTLAQEAADKNGNITVQYVPTYLMKIGDGEHTFEDLTWLSAPASDVYDWAKSKTINDVDLSTHGAITALTAAIEALDYENNAAGFVTAVTQTNGLISVTKKTLTMADITDLEDAFAESGDFDELEGRVAELEARMTDLDGVMAAVTGAMHFVGITTTDPAVSGATVQVPKTEGEGTETKSSYLIGDVVVFKAAKQEIKDEEGNVINTIPAHDIEYVNINGQNTAASWVELGDVTAEQQRLDAAEKSINSLGAAIQLIDNHSHANKGILDSIGEDNVHTHSNKDVLDGIAEGDVANWNDIYGMKDDINQNTAKTTALYDMFGNSDTSELASLLILDCGGVN